MTKKATPSFFGLAILLLTAGCFDIPPGGGTGGGSGGSSGGGAGGGGGGAFPSVDDFSQPGPFAILEENPAGCTVFRPEPLGAGGLRHPLIVWGNGTTAWPALYREGLEHLATHGFIVAAANTSNAGSGNAMLDCIDWVVEQNETSGSDYEDNVDTAHIGATGHSQGGGGALMVGRDDRIAATAPLQPYILFPNHDSSSHGEQNGPMLLLSGGNDGTAPISPHQITVFQDANVPVFWGVLESATHLGDSLGDMGRYRGPITAWFRHHLMGDELAESVFYGESCELCEDSDWTVEKKAID
jgi:hypothetical protein